MITGASPAHSCGGWSQLSPARNLGRAFARPGTSVSNADTTKIAPGATTKIKIVSRMFTPEK